MMRTWKRGPSVASVATKIVEFAVPRHGGLVGELVGWLAGWLESGGGQPRVEWDTAEKGRG